jgi:hypothetical protein
MLQLFKVLKIDAKLIFFLQLATPRITDTRSRRLPDSTIRGVGDSPYQRNAESATLRLNFTGSRRLSASLIRGVDDSPYHRYSEFSFKKFNNWLSVSVMRGVVDSAYQWWGESSTPRIVESESRRLPVSLSRGVVFRLWISPRIRSQNRNGSKCSVRDLCRTDLCKNLGNSGSFPCPFNLWKGYKDTSVSHPNSFLRSRFDPQALSSQLAFRELGD